MSIVLDIIFLLVFVISIIVTAKKGFLNSVIGVTAFVVSLIVAISISTPIADYVYKNFVREAVFDTASSAIENTISNTEASAVDKLDAFYDSLPDFVENFVKTEGMSSEEIVKNFTGDKLDATTITESLFETVVDPALTTLLNYIFVILFAIILSLLAKSLSKVITNLLKGNLIGKANSALGGVLGAISGAFIIVIIYLIITLIANNFSIVPLREAISESYVCGALSNILNK